MQLLWLIWTNIIFYFCGRVRWEWTNLHANILIHPEYKEEACLTHCLWIYALLCFNYMFLNHLLVKSMAQVLEFNGSNMATGRKEGNVLFNDALSTFYLRLYGVKDHSAREETRCRHMGYSFWVAARVLLYAWSHRHDNTYHSFCYTSCGALAGTR